MTLILDNSGDSAGTHRIGTLTIAPSQLRKLLGPPNGEGDGYKVDSGYQFRDPATGEVFTLYAYKATNLYDGDLPTPEKFWRQRRTVEFSIGGTGRVPAQKLIDFIHEEV